LTDSAPLLVAHIDHPLDWEDLPGLVSIRGWAYHREQGAARAVRVSIGGQQLPGTVGHHRPDVPSAFPDAPNDHCGFQVAFRLPRGVSSIRVEAWFGTDAAWMPLLSRDVRRPFWQWPACLGGGRPEDLLSGQLALVPAYTPRPLRPETYPRMKQSERSLPRLSIVIPSLNQAAWLEQAIDSTEAGISPGIDLHVWDGGSTDGSADLLATKSDLLASWRSEPDGGQADAVKRGLDATTGTDEDIMAWLNADDFYLPGALHFVRAYFAANPEVDVIYGNRVLVDEQSREIGRWYLPRHQAEVLKRYDFVPQETLFWRRRIWQQVGGVDASFRFALDWDLLLRMQQADARLVHLPWFLGAFRLHQHQKSQAAIGETGQAEIDRLRRRTFGRDLTPEELIHSPPIISYLRGSARAQFLASWGWRRPIK